MYYIFVFVNKKFFIKNKLILISFYVSYKQMYSLECESCNNVLKIYRFLERIINSFELNGFYVCSQAAQIKYISIFTYFTNADVKWKNKIGKF